MNKQVIETNDCCINLHEIRVIVEHEETIHGDLHERWCTMFN